MKLSAQSTQFSRNVGQIPENAPRDVILIKLNSKAPSSSERKEGVTLKSVVKFGQLLSET